MLTATGGITYIWGPGVIVNTATPNQGTVVPTVTTTYTVTGTHANGCTGTDQVTVTVNPLPVAPTTNPSNVTQYCLGATASAMSAVASSGNTLKWYDINDNLLATGATGPVPSTASAGSVTYKVTQTNSTSQCESSALLITVTVTNLPTISVVGGSSKTVCDGSSITLNGDGGVSYSWSGVDASGNAISNGASFVPPGSTTTTYTVTVNALPTISVVGGSSQTVCDGSPVILSGSGAGSGGSYSWSGGISNGVSFTPSSSSSYTVTGTDGNGCSSTATASVTVNTPPTINAGADVEICAGETVTLSGSGAGSGGSYSWSGGISDGVSFTPTVTTTYTVSAYDSQSVIVGTDQVTVTVNAIPSAPTTDPSNVTEYCLNDASPSELLATPLSGHTLIWYDASNTVLSTAASRTPSTTTVGSTLYKVTQTDVNGCESSTLNITVTVNALPTISVVGGSSQTVCDGSL